MALVLWELAGAEDDRRFSPYCWRVRLALKHKGLDFQTKPWRFTEKDAIAFSAQGKVPVLQDGDIEVHDSWAIAEYLDSAYPDRPSLLGGAAGRGLNRFVTDWVDLTVVPLIARMIVADIAGNVHPKDRDYFRSSREARFGQPLEAVSANRDEVRGQLSKTLAFVRKTLTQQPYLCGNAPGWADMALFGAFQWSRCISPYGLLDLDDGLWAWRERMLDAYDGEGRKALAFEGC